MMLYCHMLEWNPISCQLWSTISCRDKRIWLLSNYDDNDLWCDGREMCLSCEKLVVSALIESNSDANASHSQLARNTRSKRTMSATIVSLEPWFMLINTVINLIWRSSAVIWSSAEAASGHIRHCICIGSTVDPMNRCRHPLWYHMRLSLVLNLGLCSYTL